MTWRRVTIIGIFILVTLIIVLSNFYKSVQDEHWADEASAVETAYQKSILAKATKVEAFYGDKPLKIIFGEDKIGQKVIVWVSDNEVHTEMAAEGFTEEQVRNTMLGKDPDFELLRVMPGVIEGKYVWEVFYKKKSDTGTRYFYDYYTFQDGTYLDTYRLSLQ